MWNNSDKRQTTPAKDYKLPNNFASSLTACNNIRISLVPHHRYALPHPPGFRFPLFYVSPTASHRTARAPPARPSFGPKSRARARTWRGRAPCTGPRVAPRADGGPRDSPHGRAASRLRAAGLRAPLPSPRAPTATAPRTTSSATATRTSTWSANLLLPVSSSLPFTRSFI